ncbi:hypothetical protein QTP88_019071 [Uroleucon formosanum]
MVHRCILCYSASNIHKDVSFHQFPKDETRRSIWIDALSIKEVVKDWHRICSLHFSLDHFTFSNEEKILKLDAIPIISKLKIATLQSLLCSMVLVSFSISISFDTFPKDETRRSIWIDALSIKEVVKDWHRICSLHFSLDHFTFSNEEKILKLDAIPIMKEVKVEVGSCETSLEHDTSNSLIDVDSCTENNDIDIQIVTRKESTNESPPSTSKRSLDFGHKKKKYMSSSRIGDLDKDNFLTPKRRKRNLTTIKNTVTNVMNKNKLLIQKNVRLRKKVDSLNNVVKKLLNKRLISENAAINLEVKYKYRNIGDVKVDVLLTEYLFKAIKQIEHEPFDYTFKDLILKKEIKNGFPSKFVFQCNICNKMEYISNENRNSTSMSINSAIVFATLCKIMK